MRRPLLVIGCAAVVAACGGGAEIPEALQGEAERIAAIEGPDGWSRVEPPELTDSQFVREIDGVPLLFAGDFRELDQVRPISTGTAWRSPVLPDADAVATACETSATFAADAGFTDSVTDDDLADCRALPDDPDLRVDFVASYADAAVRAGDGTRTYGAGVLLAPDGTVTVVVTVAYGLDPAG